jgi:hypothetical protein
MHMSIRSILARTLILSSALVLPVLLSAPAQAHCDSMDGPVVADAQRALAQQDLTPVLKWIDAADEAEVQNAFGMTLAVRSESETAQKLADRWFFETLVRVHRASEGEGFTGLKPAGSVEPGIAAADKALEDGDVGPLAEHMATAVRDGVEERFAVAHEKRQVAEDSVEQGRDYVQAYVEFTHFVEQVDHLASHGASHQHRENLSQ